MISTSSYLEAVKEYFAFLVAEFAFILSEEMTRGAVFYDVQYRSAAQVVSISYENMEDCLLVIVYQLVNQHLPDYDDKRRTLHLNVLNHAVKNVVGPEDRAENQRHFQGLKSKGTVERQLLNSAKELRLCLMHFDEIKAV
jgi:hypothetical protein